MGCEHEVVRVGSVAVSRDGDRVILKFGDVYCRQCEAPLVLASPQVKASRDGATFEVEMATRIFDASRLRCPSCQRRLFGVCATPSAALDRGAIVDVECGEPHSVAYADGKTLLVGGNRVWDPEEDEDGEAVEAG